MPSLRIVSPVVCVLFWACGGGGGGPIIVPTLSDCATLSSDPSLFIQASGPFLDTPPGEVSVEVGQSRETHLWPPIETECRDQLTAEWRVAVEQIASVLVDESGLSVWVTGRSPGTTQLSARIRSSSGAEKQPPPASVLVSPAEPPPVGSKVIAQGEADLEPSPGDGVTPADFRRFVPITTPSAGRLQIVLDWVSPLNRIGWVLTEGHCDTPGQCGTLVAVSHINWMEPLKEFTSQQMGLYTLRIDNIGPDRETVRYEIRIEQNDAAPARAR